MNRSSRNRSRYVVGALVAAVTAVGGLLVSGPVASADICGPGGGAGCGASIDVEINGGFQEHARSVNSLTLQPNSVTVDRGSDHSQRIDLQVSAGCRLRATVLNVAFRDLGGYVKTYNFYSACVVRVDGWGGADERDTWTFDHMTVT
ncbi:hypothetical protein AB0A71_36090 [Kitasatospora aureofaciens]|uniref:hypothetical protein n=1 Tax=Kitasatospora aureofaciens TaxID=1894 RepID=UPI0033D098CF